MIGWVALGACLVGLLTFCMLVAGRGTSEEHELLHEPFTPREQRADRWAEQTIDLTERRRAFEAAGLYDGERDLTRDRHPANPTNKDAS